MSVPASRQASGAVEVAGRPRAAPAAVRATRRWLLLFLLTPVILAVIVWLVVGTSTFKEPSVPPVSVAHGYRAISDAYYGYAIPDHYAQNAAWTDQNGDYLYGTPAHGWVAESLRVSDHRPGAGARPPATFAVFGERSPTPYRLADVHRVPVAHTTVAYEMTVTRAGGWRAIALDTWLQDSSTQMWLLVRAPAGVTRTVVRSLQGS